MDALDAFSIDLTGLVEGVNELTFPIDNAFIEATRTDPDIKGGALVASLVVSRKGDDFMFDITIDGEIIVPCDKCLDDLSIPIHAKGEQQVVLTSAPDRLRDDDVISVDDRRPILNIAFQLYEIIALNVPIRKMHQPGLCNPEMEAVLQAHSAARSSEEQAATDPRWKGLEKLKRQ